MFMTIGMLVAGLAVVGMALSLRLDVSWDDGDAVSSTAETVVRQYTPRIVRQEYQIAVIDARRYL